ncbi:hypothetical protein [Streptomyces sp. NPDC006355]|uniref:hypothetical protein n=1 Tax=Streptomyces sp. NPDC006355 TaxID=3156758 RepID=UPI0033A67757
MLSEKARTRARSLGVVGAGFCIAFATATSANAHVVYEDEEVWANTDSTKCMYTYSEVSHGGRGGFTKTQGHAGMNDSGIGGCIFPWQRPAGQIIVGYQYMKHDGSKWHVCRELMHGIYNTQTSGSLTVSYDFGVAPPCGGGYYGTKAGSGVYYGGSWYGKNVPVWSGQHYIEP